MRSDADRLEPKPNEPPTFVWIFLSSRNLLRSQKKKFSKTDPRNLALDFQNIMTFNHPYYQEYLSKDVEARKIFSKIYNECNKWERE